MFLSPRHMCDQQSCRVRSKRNSLHKSMRRPGTRRAAASSPASTTSSPAPGGTIITPALAAVAGQVHVHRVAGALAPASAWDSWDTCEKLCLALTQGSGLISLGSYITGFGGVM